MSKQIRMRATAAGPDFAFSEGQILTPGVDCSPAIAKAFVDGGYAEEFDPDAPKPARQTLEDVMLGRPEHAADVPHPSETTEAIHKRGRRGE